MAPPYQFRPMTAGDLPMLQRWLATPHVIEWWGDPDEQFGLVSGDLDEPAMDQFTVALDDRPFAYIQSYNPEAWQPHPFGEQPSGTCGIDQFIGDLNMIGRGHGSGFIRQFTDGLLASGIPRVLTDPDPANARAVRAYEKAGFTGERLVDAPDGIALLMVRNA